MTVSNKPVPEGFRTVTPTLVVRDAARAIEFYKKALGAEELVRMPSPDGKIMHCELKIGDSVIFLTDEMDMPGSPKSPQTLGGVTGTIQLYVPNVDQSFKQAISAGGTESMPVADQFWGDRWGSFTDPFGHSWGIGTHKEDLSPAEMEQRAQEFFSNFAKKKSA